MSIVWNARLNRFQNTETGQIVSYEEGLLHSSYDGRYLRDEAGHFISPSLFDKPSGYEWFTKSMIRVTTDMIPLSAVSEEISTSQQFVVRSTAVTPDGRVIRVWTSMPVGERWDSEEIERKLRGLLTERLKQYGIGSKEVTKYEVKRHYFIRTYHS